MMKHSRNTRENLILGVALGVRVILGVGDILILGVADGVALIVGVAVGVTDGSVGQVAQIGKLPSTKGQPPVLKLDGSEGIGNTHHRVKSWLNANAPENI